MKLLPAILTTHKYKDRQESILKTWLSYTNWLYLFYTDKSTGINQLECTDNDSYYSGAIKLLSCLNYLKDSEFHNSTWILFCDDDTVPNIKLINSILPSLDTNIVYGKAINCFTDMPDLVYPSGGAGFLVNIKKIKTSKVDFNILYKTFYSDVAFGLWMTQNNIKLINDDRFNMDCPELISKEALTYHYVKDHQTREKITKIFQE